MNINRILAAALSSMLLLPCCTDYTKYVNVFSGTDGVGHCHPCACTPFGAIQCGPQTGNFG